MIAICEPQSKGYSHEKVNSGFIYGLHLAFPNDVICFYAHSSHIRAIQKILIHDKIIIKNIKYIPIKYGNNNSLIGILRYYFLFQKIFHAVLKQGSNKIFFLSFSPVILYCIKRLKHKLTFRNMKFTFVLHGSFEKIATDNTLSQHSISLVIKKIPNRHFLKKIKNIQLGKFLLKIQSLVTYYLNTPWRLILNNIFQESEILLKDHSNDFHYIALSPHIISNAKKYIDTDFLNIYTIILPTNFEDITPQPNNKHVKFAIFGYGDSLMLYNIASLLLKKDSKASYEIRIIGMDNRGIEDFPNITCPSNGKILDRNDMKRYSLDIDIFLILYDSTKYKLSCSNSILEALSYNKPIIHFNNDCINMFNTNEHPIGISCSSLEEYVNTMQYIINNYNAYKVKLDEYRRNILKLRTKFSIANSVNEIQKSFLF